MVSVLKILKHRLFGVGENRVELLVRGLLRRQAFLVGNYPVVFIVGPLLITSLLIAGVVKVKTAENVVLLYAPSDAPAFDEYRTAQEYFDDENGMYLLKLIIYAKDGGDLLRSSQYASRVLFLMDYIENNYTLTYENFTYSFKDIQINHKNENDALKMLLTVYKNGNGASSRISYPATRIGDETYSMTASIGGVTVDQSGAVESATLALVRFRSAWGDITHQRRLKAWEKNFLHPESVYNDDLLNFIGYSGDLMSHEIQKNGPILAPYVGVSFFVLMLFAVSTSMTSDCVTSKPWEAFAGVLCTILSSGAAFGVVFFTGYEYISIMIVVPVLVLALGLDVTFIVIRSWRSTSPDLDPTLRLAETLEDSGPSIVITTLTNVISAGVGTITTTLAVRLFCMTTAIAVAILFFLQITLLPAAMVLGGRREQKRLNSCFCYSKKRIADRVPKKHSQTSPGFKEGNKQQQETHRTSDWWDLLSNKLSVLLCKNFFRLLVTLVLFIYWSISIWGCINLQVGMTPDKYFLPTSILNKYLKIDNNGLHQALTIYVFLSKAPNFSNPIESGRFEELVTSLEKLPYSFSPETTTLWIRPYKAYLNFIEANPEQDFYINLDGYLSGAAGPRWRRYITLENRVDPIQNRNYSYVSKFFFSTCYRAASSWTERAEFAQDWRDIVNAYPEFNASLWDDESENFITDQLISIPGNTLQDVIITAVSMGLICALFIPNVFNTACAMLTILSINVGVFGFLVHWGVSLDGISMASLLMSIGFSVDFTSHISFHYFTTEGDTQREKLSHALSSIGYPMLQTGVSTALSIACLCVVPSYMVWVFFKTIFLVVTLGLLHGLIILPTYLAWLPLNFWNCLYEKNTVVISPDLSLTKDQPISYRETLQHSGQENGTAFIHNIPVVPSV